MPIRKLTQEEMDKVLELATAMREQDRDKYHLGHAVLYLNERKELLEDLRKKAEYYVRFGLAEKELRDLRVALDKLRELDVDVADETSMFSNS